MHALMMERPLLISGLLEHAERFHPEREVAAALFVDPPFAPLAAAMAAKVPFLQPVMQS